LTASAEENGKKAKILNLSTKNLYCIKLLSIKGKKVKVISTVMVFSNVITQLT